jgi:hypothetical protein
LRKTKEEDANRVAWLYTSGGSSIFEAQGSLVVVHIQDELEEPTKESVVQGCASSSDIFVRIWRYHVLPPGANLES